MFLNTAFIRHPQPSAFENGLPKLRIYNDKKGKAPFFKTMLFLFKGFEEKVI